MNRNKLNVKCVIPSVIKVVLPQSVFLSYDQKGQTLIELFCAGRLLRIDDAVFVHESSALFRCTGDIEGVHWHVHVLSKCLHSRAQQLSWKTRQDPSNKRVSLSSTDAFTKRPIQNYCLSDNPEGGIGEQKRPISCSLITISLRRRNSWNYSTASLRWFANDANQTGSWRM